MIALKLGDISDFPFIDRPDAKSIKDGFDLLFELGAIKQRRKAQGARRKALYEAPKSQPAGDDAYACVALTDIGRLMTKIPLDPRLSRMLIEAKSQGCMDEIAVIASVLSIQDPRERPAEKTREADRMHSVFNDPHSDFVTLLNIWNRYQHTWRRLKTNNQIKRFCREYYLSYRRMREWRDIYHQICTLLEEHGLGRNIRKLISQETNYEMPAESSRYAAIHKSILSGFLSNIAEKKEKNIFRAAKGRDVMIFPGSGIFDRAANWIVAAEVVETSRVFARTVANIDSTWLEDLGGELCRRSYLHPHWERNRGDVVASEQVSLFGLIIVPERKASYGKINPEEACDIFIRRALIEGDVKKPFAFMKHNQRLIDDLKAIEDRIRRRDVLIGEEEMVDFYKDRIEGIYNLRALATYLKTKGNHTFLRMKKEDLLLYRPLASELSLYPQRIKLGDHLFGCSYRFEPGEADDGVTVKVPATLAPQVPAEAMDWLVLGLYKEKIAALIKSLPKAYRRKLVPVNATVDVIAGEMQHAEGSLIAALGHFIYKRFGVDIPASAWPVQTLPDHLKMRIAITAADGREISASRDPAILRYHTNEKANLAGFESARKKWEKTGIARWEFGNLPDYVSPGGSKTGRWIAYPALEKSQTGEKNVNLRLFRKRDEAIAAHKQGVAVLYRNYFSKDLKFLKKLLRLPADIIPKADYFGGAGQFEKKLMDRVIQTLFAKNIRSQNEFHAYAERVATNIITSAKQLIENVLPIVSAYDETRRLVYRLQQANPNNATAVQFFNNIIEELVRLVPENFIELYDPDRLVHIERYVKAVGIRAQRALVDFEKDQTKQHEVHPEEKRKAVEEYFWMVEEYKVSVFAQELKTDFPVSKKRLQDKLRQIENL
jgi:ATP-dependent helicase HrpA